MTHDEKINVRRNNEQGFEILFERWNDMISIGNGWLTMVDELDNTVVGDQKIKDCCFV